MNKLKEEHKESNFLKKFGRWTPIIGGIWVGSHIIIPLALLRMPIFQEYLIALESKLPFNIPGVG